MARWYEDEQESELRTRGGGRGPLTRGRPGTPARGARRVAGSRAYPGRRWAWLYRSGPWLLDGGVWPAGDSPEPEPWDEPPHEEVERGARRGNRSVAIIDCHCHAGTGDGLTGPWDTAARIDAYLRRAEQAGIQRTVLFAPFHSDYAAANREVARIVASRPERFWGFAVVNAARDRGRVLDLVREAVQHHGFRGLKVHRHDARLTREVCEAAQSLGLPLLYDVMGEVSQVELLASEYPRVDFIIPHLGSFSDDWRAQRALLDVLARKPNVYADTSGVRRFDLLEEAVARAGAGKLLFGSDGPWLHPGVELAKVRALKLPPEDERRVLGGNLLRLMSRRRARPVGRVSRWRGPPPDSYEEPRDPWLGARAAGDY